MCAHLWRADACAQGVPVARTAGGPYVYGSNGDSQEYARVQGIRHMKCEAAAAILASEGPAPVSVGRQHARSSCDFAQHVSPVTGALPNLHFHTYSAFSASASHPGIQYFLSNSGLESLIFLAGVNIDDLKEET